MGRSLNVLVIDDRASWLKDGLGTNHLDVLKIPYKEGEPLQALTGWSQHLWLWRNNRFPESEADLVLIDCKYENDDSAPKLAGQDPRGLLHGAIYLARLLAHKRINPLGFNIYSQNAPALKDDPYAQTFVGFLLAMIDSAREDEKPSIFGETPTYEWANVCEYWLAQSAGQTPKMAWGPALEMYRNQLKVTFAQGAYRVRRESWNNAIKHLNASRWQEDLSLSWYRNDGSIDEVNLASLFADALKYDRWSEAAEEQALKWLHQLTIPDINFLETTTYWLNQLYINKNGEISILSPMPNLPRGSLINPSSPTSAETTYTHFAHACAAVVSWILDRRKGRLTSSGRLVELIGLSAKQADRYFIKIAHMNWGDVVDHLDNSIKGRPGNWDWPFPYMWQLKDVVQEWWKRNFPGERVSFH